MGRPGSRCNSRRAPALVARAPSGGSAERELGDAPVWNGHDRPFGAGVLPDHVVAERKAAEDRGQPRLRVRGPLVHARVDAVSVAVDAGLHERTTHAQARLTAIFG